MMNSFYWVHTTHGSRDHSLSYNRESQLKHSDVTATTPHTINEYKSRQEGRYNSAVMPVANISY